MKKQVLDPWGSLEISNYEKVFKQFGLSKKYLVNLLYLVSIAVKDFEVTKLLVERGYVDDQTVYSYHMLETSEEDLDTWNIAKGNPISIVLSLAARFKDAACFIALPSRLDDSQIAGRLRKELSYLPDPILENMLKFLEKFSQVMVGDTFQNVTTAIKIFTKDLLSTIIS